MAISWFWLLLACALAFTIKLVGYLLPARWLQGAGVQRTATAMTIGLLAALLTINTLGDGTGLVLDARIAALLAAALALALRAPFLLVVIMGAASAAAVRCMFA